MNDEDVRKRRQRAEFKLKVIDEKKTDQLSPGERKFIGKGKTRVDVHPTLKSSAEQYGEKDKQKTTATESSCDPIASGARAMVRSTAKKIRMKKPVNETNHLDELSGATLRRYKASATDDLRGMSSLKKETDYPGRPKDSLDKKIRSRAGFVKLAKRKMQEEEMREELASQRAGSTNTPLKMKYTGESFAKLTKGQHVFVHRIGHGGGVRVHTGNENESYIVHRKELDHIKEEALDELSYDTLSSYRRKSIGDSVKRLSTRDGASDQHKLTNRKQGSNLAWSKMGLSHEQPRVRSSEGEAAQRKADAIHADAMNRTQPSTKAMSDGVSKMQDLAANSAHLFKRPKQPFAALKARNTHEETQIDELSRKSLVNYTLKAEKAKALAKDQRTIDKRDNGQKQALKKIGSKVFKEEHSFITDLRLAIETNGIHPVTFADGARAAISPGYADRVLAKYEAISEENKRNEFVSTVSSSLKTLRESVKR